MCPGAKKSRDEMKVFIDVAAQHIAARLNSAAPGANLDPQDVYALIHLCPFETVAKEKLSPFCSLFSEDDFEIYEYAGDLQKFYNAGYAFHLSAFATPLIDCPSGMGLHLGPYKASGTSMNSSGASRIPPHTTVYKPTVPCSFPPRPSRSIGRCTSISRMTT